MKFKDYIICILLVVCMVVSSVSLIKSDVIQGETGVQGIQGEVGSSGLDGKDGEKGDKGDTGNGIASMKIDNGNLVVTYTNGTTANLGAVGSLVGADGKDGVDGKDGKNGTNGINGKDGADGVSITNTYTQDGYLYITLSNGKTINAGYVKGEDGEDGKDATNANGSAYTKTVKTVKLENLFAMHYGYHIIDRNYGIYAYATWYGQSYNKLREYQALSYSNFSYQIFDWDTFFNDCRLRTLKDMGYNDAKAVIIGESYGTTSDDYTSYFALMCERTLRIYNACGLYHVAIEYLNGNIKHYNFEDGGTTLNITIPGWTYESEKHYTEASSDTIGKINMNTYIKSITVEYYDY